MQIRSRGTIVVLALAFVVVLATPAAAHNQVIDTAPGDGATVTAPVGAVLLRVDHPPLEPLAEHTTITVTAPGGDTVSGAVTPDAPQRLAEPIPVLIQEDGEWVQDYHWEAYPLRVPLTSLPEEGTYTVDYSVADSDGHPTTGSFTFDYEGATGPVPGGAPDPEAGPTLVHTASAEEAAAAEPAPDAATPASQPPPTASDPAEDDGPAVAPIAAGVGAVVLVGAGAGAVWRRSHRPAAPAKRTSRRGRSRKPAPTRRSPSAKRPR